jgi:hypothetical protein
MQKSVKRLREMCKNGEVGDVGALPAYGAEKWKEEKRRKKKGYSM